MYELKQFQSPRGCLSYIINDKISKKAAIIDPSEEMDIQKYLDHIKNNELKLQYIIDTHTHADHISSASKLKELTDAKIVMHKNSPTKRKDIEVSDGDILDLTGIQLKIIHTPGHTNESICVNTEDVLFTGDTLLIEGIGRTDFQLGDSEELYRSLWEKLMKLEDNTKVYPAHDYKGKSQTTIKEEKEKNPRLQLSRDDFIKTMNDLHPPKPDLFEEAIKKNSE